MGLKLAAAGGMEKNRMKQMVHKEYVLISGGGVDHYPDKANSFWRDGSLLQEVT